MVLAIILPEGFAVNISVHIVHGEFLSVKIAYEILGGGTAVGTSRVDVADEHPFLLVSALDRKFEQVRTFPDSLVIAVTLAEA